MIYLPKDVRNHQNRPRVVCERSIDQTGVLCVVLHVGDLVLVLNRSDCLLAKNRQSFVLMGHSRLLIYSLEMLFNPLFVIVMVTCIVGMSLSDL